MTFAALLATPVLKYSEVVISSNTEEHATTCFLGEMADYWSCLSGLLHETFLLPDLDVNGHSDDDKDVPPSGDVAGLTFEDMGLCFKICYIDVEGKMSCLSTRLAVLPWFQSSWSSTLYAVHNVSSQTWVISAYRLFWNTCCCY